MKTFFSIIFIFMSVVACNSGGTNNAGNTDGASLTNPSSIDTTIHPNGITNSDVMTTDTAAMNTQNAYKKLDSVKHKN